MGEYLLGDIISMTRKSLSITQEQLSDGICSVETLSRVENGKQKPNREVYDLLMRRMGRYSEVAYSITSISDYNILDKLELFETYIDLYDYKQAESILDDIKKIIGNSILDKQFLIRANSIIQFRLKKINSAEFLQNLENAILLTVPQYGRKALSGYPMNYQEIRLIINISSAYAQIGNIQKAIDILQELYLNLNKPYINEQKSAVFQITILNNLSKWYGLLTNYKKAIEIANEGIYLCKKYKLGNTLTNLLYGVIWNKEQIYKNYHDSKIEKECIRGLIRIYYIACSMQQSYIQQFIKDHLKTKYDIDSLKYIV